jgi:general stress protein 26
MTKTLTDIFWSNLSKIHVVLLSTGDGTPVPMSPLSRQEDGVIWFITSANHDSFKAAEAGATADIYLCDSACHMYGTIKGSLSASHDDEKLDALWSPLAAAWFDKGREDDTVRLMKYIPHKAEIWATDGIGKYLLETIRANVTNAKPDTGEYGIIHFKEFT